MANATTHAVPADATHTKRGPLGHLKTCCLVPIFACRVLEIILPRPFPARLSSRRKDFLPSPPKIQKEPPDFATIGSVSRANTISHPIPIQISSSRETHSLHQQKKTKKFQDSVIHLTFSATHSYKFSRPIIR